MSADQNTANVVPGSAEGPTATNQTASSSSTGASPELHSRVVEMLATVLNGGFAELGYHPDHLTQVHNVHEWNLRLRDENARLFSDNRRLAQLIGMQNTRLVSSAPNGGNNAATHELQSRIQELELSRQEIVRQNEQLAHEVMVMRAELGRLSHILQLKGIAHEMTQVVPSASGPKMVTQPVALAPYPGQEQRPRHSQLPPINTSFSAHSAQSAPALQGYSLPAASAGSYPYGPLIHPQMGGSRNANGPVMASLTQDPHTLQRMYAENASAPSSSRPNTAPTRVTQGSSTPVVDLTGEPDSDDDRRQAKKARLASLPAASRPTTATSARPSTPQIQSSAAYAGPVNGQAQLGTNAGGYASSAPLLWLTPNRDVPALTTDEDIQMHSPTHDAPRQVPMEVVQQAQALLESPPVNPQSTDTALLASNSGTGVPMDEQRPAESGPNPSAEVIQQCIDENFINAENADAGGGDQEGSEKRVCRMCQIRYTRGLSENAPEVFPAEASTDELARHCQEEHPKGWLILLQRCMEDEESDEDE